MDIDLTPPDDLNPDSENYRYRDTGYIAGSRKEVAAERIRLWAREGQRAVFDEIDWNDLESNPRVARDLITKSNLFGEVDWDALRQGGMEPGAGFLLDRIYAAVGVEPEDSPKARHDYTYGLGILRDRLEACRTPRDIRQALDVMREEFDGEILLPEEAERFAALGEEYHQSHRHSAQEKKKLRDLWDAYYALQGRLRVAQHEQEKRVNRKWKPDPKLDARTQQLKTETEAAEKTWDGYRKTHPELVDQKRNLGNGRYTYCCDLDLPREAIGKEMEEIKRKAKARNILENPAHRAWLRMGNRFMGVLFYASHKGSDAFHSHLTKALNGKIEDWSWLKTEGEQTARRETKRDVAFRLKVAEKLERTGGESVACDSTQDLKDRFGLRDIQSGNWVLQDPMSAKFHIQSCAEALADLARLLGIQESEIGLGGELAMAFGARGAGNTGFRNPAAHYEPLHRVINLTKMKGGGCLGHEWFHALDNLVPEILFDKKTSKGDFVTQDTSSIDRCSPLLGAYERLMSAILMGEMRLPQKIKYTADDVKLAKHNLERQGLAVVDLIRNAGSLEKCVDALSRHYDRVHSSKSNRDGWFRIAAARYDNHPEGGSVTVHAGPKVSSFAYEACRLDGGSFRKYWSAPHELASRAFQSWIEDRLAERGQKSDYLSCMADNKYYIDPVFGPQKPFPEGEERQRINWAFDHWADALRDAVRQKNTAAQEQEVAHSCGPA